MPLGADARSRLYLPLADDEAFWIGAIGTDPPLAAELAVRVEVQRRGSVDALSGKRWNARVPRRIAISTFSTIDGIRRAGGGLWVFARRSAVRPAPACKSLHFTAQAVEKPHRRAVASIELVDYPTFRERTDTVPPAPLDPDAGYKGWRLP